MTFLSGFGLTATFENIGQNKALKFNKLRQVFICMNAAGTGWSFALIFFASSAAAQPSLYRAIILCDRVPVSVPQNVVFSSFFSTSLSSFLSSCVFFFSSPLPFLRLNQGSLQSFSVPYSLSFGIRAEKGNILPSRSTCSICFEQYSRAIPSCFLPWIRLGFTLKVNEIFLCSPPPADMTGLVFQGFRFMVGDSAGHLRPMPTLQCQCRQWWPSGSMANTKGKTFSFGTADWESHSVPNKSCWYLHVWWWQLQVPPEPWPIRSDQSICDVYIMFQKIEYVDLCPGDFCVSLHSSLLPVQRNGFCSRL